MSTQAKAKTTKNQAAKTKAQAEQATAQAARTGEDARKAMTAVVRDGAYAALGAGDFAVGYVRTAGSKAAELRLDALRRDEIDRLARAVPERVRTLRSDAATELGELRARGRAVMERIRQQDSTKQALERTEVARRQVKAASTSVRKAVTSAVEGAEATAASVGRPRR